MMCNECLYITHTSAHYVLYPHLYQISNTYKLVNLLYTPRSRNFIKKYFIKEISWTWTLLITRCCETLIHAKTTHLICNPYVAGTDNKELNVLTVHLLLWYQDNEKNVGIVIQNTCWYLNLGIKNSSSAWYFSSSFFRKVYIWFTK